MLRVQHHVPGRIRFKVEKSYSLHGISEWLKQSIIAIQGIKDVRVNAFASSLVVEYDSELLAPNIIEARVNALDLDGAEHSEEEHQYTKGDVALNVIGILCTLFLPSQLAALSSSILTAPALIEGLEQVSDKKLSIEVLDAVAIGLSLWRRDYKTAMMTQTLISLGEYLEQETTRNSDKLLADLMQTKDTKVWRVSESGELEKVLSSELCVSDVIEITPGSVIPIDGHITSGTAFINQASLTGESVPVRREEGAVVYAGTTVSDGSIRVHVDKIGSESTTAQIAKMIFDSLSEKSEIQQVTQEMAQRRVKITLAIGSGVFLLTQDLNRVASVFLVDYSCALKLSTPVTFKSIMYRAAQNHILLKGGPAVEQLAQVDTIVFDKTGTLTYGDMEVTDVVSFCPDNSARDILAMCASVEEHSNHPLSQAVVNAAKNNELPHIDHGEVEYIIAHGLKSTVNQHQLVMGSRHFLEEHEHVDFSQYEAQITQYEEMGRHLIFISNQGNLSGMIGLIDHVREEAFEVLQRMKEQGVKRLIMISGDAHAKAEKLATELGLDDFYAEATPNDKATIIEQLCNKGYRVAFVGDGVNDAPALSEAHVGIAMKGGTELARQVSDVVLMKDSLYGLIEARVLATLAMKTIQSNIKITEYVNSGIMVAAAMGWINPTISALLHNGTTLGVLARSMALRKTRH